jgi:primary-amine oxidase
VQVNASPIPLGPQNPYGNAYAVGETALESTHQAQRMCAPEQARHWKIKNPAHINPITQEPVSYKLLPGSNVVMLAQPGSLLHRRAQFAVKHLWVTPHDDAQKYPAGDHVVSSSECLGLAQWTKQDAPLQGADPVLWYSFGVTHIPRIEDFPVMPCESVGFQMRPCGFFVLNPSNDLPPDRNMLSKEDCCERPGRALAGSRL